MTYVATTLRRELDISQIITIHYFEYDGSFCFLGETHDFWELVFVDSGMIEVGADGEWHHLKRGEIFFHYPGQFHALKAYRGTAPALAVVSFVCQSPLLRTFWNRKMLLNEKERGAIYELLAEARQAFASPLNDPHVECVCRRTEQTFGAEQLLRSQLERLLILLLRRVLPAREAGYAAVPQEEDTADIAEMLAAENDEEAGQNVSGNDLPAQHEGYHRAEAGKSADISFEFTVTRGEPVSGDKRFTEICTYLSEHLTEKMSVSRICADRHLGRSTLEACALANAGCGIMEVYYRMKIKKASELIRENKYSMLEIADQMGYSSQQYFSRQFKEVSGMSPSAYARVSRIFSSRPAAAEKDEGASV